MPPLKEIIFYGIFFITGYFAFGFADEASGIEFPLIFLAWSAGIIGIAIALRIESILVAILYVLRLLRLLRKK